MDFRNKLKSLVNKDLGGGSSNNKNIVKSTSHHAHLSTNSSTNHRKQSLTSTLSSFRPFSSSTSSHSISNPSNSHSNNSFEHHGQLYSRYKLEKEIRKSSSNRRDESYSSTVSNNLNNRAEVSQGDKDVLSSIEAFYFEPHDEAACQSNVIDKLPPADEPLDLEYIIAEKNRLKKQLSVVTKKVTDVMMTHQGTYFAELQKVIHLQTSLNDAINTCSLSRKRLAVSRHNLTVMPLKVIHDFHVKSHIKSVISATQESKPRQEYSNQTIVTDIMIDQNVEGLTVTDDDPVIPSIEASKESSNQIPNEVEVNISNPG